MNTVGLATLVLTGAIAALSGAPEAVASPELDFCRDMAAVGYSGDCTTLAGLAKDVCAQYDRGVDWEGIVARLDATTQDEGLSNFIMAGAPLYFCPEHDDKT